MTMSQGDREACGHHKCNQEEKTDELGILIKTGVWARRRTQEVWVILGTHHSWFLLCDSLAVSYPTLNGSSLDSKILVSVKSQHGKISTTVEIGPKPSHQ